MTDREKAMGLGRRAFYERGTLSIRSCPENYCLAVQSRQSHSGWISGSRGTDPSYKHLFDKIEAVIDTFGRWSTGDALAEAIGEVLPVQEEAKNENQY